MAKFEQSVNIGASVDTVWSILESPEQWPQWLPGVEGVTGFAGMQAGSKFRFEAGGQAGTGSVIRVEPKRVLRIVTETGGHEATHSFDLGQRGVFGGSGKSRLRYTLEYKAVGGALGEFVAGGNPADMIKAKNTVTRVKELAEREAGIR
jgi:uncharacterized protein YndB with AHSA1/START domain